MSTFTPASDAWGEADGVPAGDGAALRTDDSAAGADEAGAVTGIRDGAVDEQAARIRATTRRAIQRDNLLLLGSRMDGSATSLIVVEVRSRDGSDLLSRPPYADVASPSGRRPPRVRG